MRQVGVNGGLPETLSPTQTDSWDWSVNDELLMAGPSHSIEVFKRRTSESFNLLSDPDSELYQAHFSNDGLFVTFNSVTGQYSQIYAASFRPELVPKTQWIKITDGTHWDDKPRFSPDDKLLFFTSDRDGYRCLWAQPLTNDMHPTHDAFAVYHFHSPQRSIGLLNLGQLELGVAPGLMVFNQGERKGSIWLLDPK